MPFNYGEILIGALSPVLNQVTTEKLGVLFDKMHEKDAEGHAAAIKAMYIGVGQLQRLTDDTKNKIDDAVVDALAASIEATAEKYGVELAA